MRKTHDNGDAFLAYLRSGSTHGYAFHFLIIHTVVYYLLHVLHGVYTRVAFSQGLMSGTRRDPGKL